MGRRKSSYKQKSMSKRLNKTRIVKIRDFMRQIQSDRHPGGFGCSIMDSSFVKELRQGLRSSLVYKCRMCNKETTLDTDHSDDKSLSINTAVIWIEKWGRSVQASLVYRTTIFL
ncbi:hypothetical protein FOCC_FOCC011968 [Frankliniella occidentalis]|nr:hypothetical protein FOCC_FOCC011968 [Frankliniella occidentalis]